MRQFWNANSHYHDLVLASLGSDASRVLEVGCGEGLLSAELLENGVAHVVALDADRAVLERARARHEGRGIEWALGDIHTVSLEPESFDAVVSVAALHHMDAAQSLSRFAELVRPGGTVVVIGLAAYSWWDIPLECVAIGARLVLGVTYKRWDHSAPECWPPPLTYSEMKALSTRVLPGVRYRRHLLGRYSLVWRKPQGFAVTANSDRHGSQLARRTFRRTFGLTHQV